MKQVYEWNTSNFWSICKPDKFDSALCEKENVTFTGKFKTKDPRTMFGHEIPVKFVKGINPERLNVCQ